MDGREHDVDAQVAAARAALDAVEDTMHDLKRAIITNRRTGMAVGILMITCHVSDAEAFRLLMDASQRGNVKLRDIAEEVINIRGATWEDGSTTQTSEVGASPGRQPPERR